MFIIQYVRCDNSEYFLSSMLWIYLPTQYVPKGGNCAWTTGKWSRTYILKSYQFCCMHASLEAVTLVRSSHSLTHTAKYTHSHWDSALIHICADTCFFKARVQITLNLTFYKKFHKNRANWHIYCINILPKWHSHLPIRRQADASLTIIFRIMCQDSLWQQQLDTSAVVSDGAFPVFCCLKST